MRTAKKYYRNTTLDSLIERRIGVITSRSGRGGEGGGLGETFVVSLPEAAFHKSIREKKKDKHNTPQESTAFTTTVV